MKRIPRKKKKKIPDGVYCYSPVEFPSNDNGFVYKIKSCPFYSHCDGLKGYCTLIKVEIIDQVKECGANFRYEKRRMAIY